MQTLYTIGIDFGTSNSCVSYATYYDRGNGDVDPDRADKCLDTLKDKRFAGLEFQKKTSEK